MVEIRTLHPVEGGRLVELIDDSHRREQQSGPEGERRREDVVQVQLLECYFPARLAALDPGVLQLQLGPERQLGAEGVSEIQHEPANVDDRRGVWAARIGIVNFPVPADRCGFTVLGLRGGPQEDGQADQEDEAAGERHAVLLN